ncbi:uncharacterized protein LDX57_001874 [Aspergillus melleus]|uniref:uncharacterized protein n=1 Tax=Aspergillus melleus TaxID=138277 RepID=UPI001E8DADB1|nr:uncharacterized protein LDX57_001874 [Aspergillus melleus]KAH8424120.1 hypothetical protein LDX57_001874 [Aspergillus melleus]
MHGTRHLSYKQVYDRKQIQKHIHITTMTSQLQYPSSVSSPSSSSDSSAASRPWNPHPDDSSTEDEEEVLFDLDEAAMAELPVHLQRTMREIQRERVRRFSQRPENMALAVNLNMNMTMVIRTSPRTPRTNGNYADRWVRNVMARMSTDQETSMSRGTREMVDVDADMFEREGPDETTAAYTADEEHSMSTLSGRYYGRTMSERNALLGCVGSFERNALARCNGGRRVEVPEEKFAAEHVSEIDVLAAGNGDKMQQQRGGKRGQFRKTIMSAVRVRVKKSFQRMSMLLRSERG